MRIEIPFRGEERDVVVDRVDDDPETNSFSAEWHFDGLSPEDHDALGVTDNEEEAILNFIAAACWESDT